MNPKVEGPLRLFWCPLGATTSGIKGSHTPICGLVHSVRSTKFVYCKWWLNTAETCQRGYELVHSVAWYSFLYCQAGLPTKHGQSDDASRSIWYLLAANFASRVSPCTGIVEPFNPLTTDDECTCHATLAACYQLAQSVLKIHIGFALAKKAG